MEHLSIFTNRGIDFLTSIISKWTVILLSLSSLIILQERESRKEPAFQGNNLSWFFFSNRSVSLFSILLSLFLSLHSWFLFTWLSLFQKNKAKKVKGIRRKREEKKLQKKQRPLNRIKIGFSGSGHLRFLVNFKFWKWVSDFSSNGSFSGSGLLILLHKFFFRRR